APDGSIFVADWYDPHVGGHNVQDWDRGRIYRLALKGSKPPTKPNATGSEKPLSVDAAVAALWSPNQAERYLAWAALKGSDDPKAATSLGNMAYLRDSLAKARALWLVAARGNLDPVWKAAKDFDPAIRAEAVRILANAGLESFKAAAFMLDDPDAG